MLGKSAHIGDQQHGLGALKPVSQIPGNVDHPLQLCDRVVAIGIIVGAEIQGVISCKQFWRVNDQAHALVFGQDLVKIDLEVFVTEVNLDQIQVADLGEHGDVVVPHR